jgi:hypothetical protein
MPHGAHVEGGAARTRLIPRHVRDNIKRTAIGDNVAGVVDLVPAQSDSPAARQVFIDHRQRRAPFNVAVGRFNLEVHQKGAAVLHRRVGPVAQLGLLARAFLRQLTLRREFFPSLAESLWQKKSFERLPCGSSTPSPARLKRCLRPLAVRGWGYG